MSESKTLPRPPQVTLAGGIVIVGSVIVLFSVFDMVSGGRSIETRERVRDALAQAPLKGAGVTLTQALDFLHITALVAAACATVAGILGIYVLQCSKSARLALTIVAPFLFLTGMVTGGFMSSMVAVAAVMLWTMPARDWFNGIPPRKPEPETPAQRQSGTSGPRSFIGFGSPKSAPREDTSTGVEEPERSGHGQDDPSRDTVGQDLAQPAGGEAPAYTQTPVASRPAMPKGRPREVLQACLLTWVFCGLALLAMLVAILAFATSPDMIRDVYESDSRFTDVDVNLDQLRGASIAMASVFALWSLIAAGLAVFTFLGHNWARITLIISAAVAGLLTLVMVFAAPVIGLVTIATVLTIVMLTRGRSNEFFLSRSRHRP